MNSISEVVCKWKPIENDNSWNIAPPCRQCLPSLSPGGFKVFLHLVSSPRKSSLWNSTSAAAQEHSHSTSQPAESTWKQFSFNQVHYKGPSDANLSNTTILFFSAPSLSIILIFHEPYEILFTDIMRILFEFIALSGQIQIYVRS